MVAIDRIHEALTRVHDPELDQNVEELGFVADVRIDGARVAVDLRLPTYFCAPNFAWVMVADAHAQVSALDEVAHVEVRLLDHMAAAEITAGVAGGRTFDQTFPGLADGSELADLRTQFQRKAHIVRQEQVARRLRDTGTRLEDLASLRLGQLRDVPDRQRLIELRHTLAFDTSPSAPLLLHDDGTPVAADEVDAFLTASRLTRVSVEGNRDFCEGVLATRADHDAIHGATDARPLAPPATRFVPTGASA